MRIYTDPVSSRFEANAPLLEEQRAHRHLVDEEGAANRIAVALSAASVVACVSEPVAGWARQHGAERVIVAPNGVNTDRIRPRAADGAAAPGPELVVGFVGTLRPWHGVETLVDAMAELGPRTRMRIIGDGPAASDLRERARAHGVALEITGAVAPADIPAHLAGLDVGVAPYPAGDHYFSPLKVYEYLAAGLPVVASRIGQITDLIDDGTTGILTEPGDAASLATALAALQRDPARRTRIGRAARVQAVEQHDWRHVLQRIRDAVPEGGGSPRVGEDEDGATVRAARDRQIGEDRTDSPDSGLLRANRLSPSTAEREQADAAGSAGAIA